MKTICIAATRASHARFYARGVSLLEVLIAIVIMSFGLLAMGGLTAASLQYGKMAQFQTVAVQLASELTDRMRANADGFYNKNGTGLCTANTGCYDKTSAYSPTVSVQTAATCTSCTYQDIAAIDMAEWRTNLRNSLPGGDAYVLRDAADPPAVDIWIMWVDPSLKSGTDTSLITAGSSSCPLAAVPTTATIVPHCLYFRAGI